MFTDCRSKVAQKLGHLELRDVHASALKWTVIIIPTRYLTLLFDPKQRMPCNAKRTFALVSSIHTTEKEDFEFAKEEKMPETKITLYTDVISPFGYLAWHILNVHLL
jgi:alkyl hydroperoxide reductase subunit AhpC